MSHTATRSDPPELTAQRPAASTPAPVPGAFPRRPRGHRVPPAVWIAAAVVLVLGAGYAHWAAQWPRSVRPGAQLPMTAAPPPTPTAAPARTVRAHLDRQDLTAARAALGNLPAADRQDPAVPGLRDELAKQEARRDSQLEAARKCLQKREWECAANRALGALAVDRSSNEARQIVERIRSLGLDPARKTGAPGPRPPVTSNPPSSGGTAAAPTECQATLTAGRRALAAGRFDEAIARANDPVGALGFCPEVEKLKQDAMRAKSEALR